jgi:hypothetical protein
MGNKVLKSVLQDALEEQIPSSQIDLLSGIEARLSLAKKPAFRKVERSGKARANQFAFSILTSVGVLVIMLITPQGRALAQSILHFFVRTGSDRLPMQSFQTTSAPATITPDPGYIFDQSISEAEQKAGFKAILPRSIPENLSFQGASYEPEHNIVRLFYSYEDTTNGLVLREERFQTNDDCELCGVVGASAEIRIVQVGDVNGEYVEGVWNLTANGPVWVSDPYLKTLRWQKDGMAFELLYMGPPEEVTKEKLIAIAESMK